jgi:glycosyltransferase involved in cell wall biosynthesis
MKKRFSIITPCYNAANLIEETIESVINQTAVSSKKIDLEYYIIDGSSMDNTLEIALKYSKKYDYIKVLSEKDSGMYEALVKGFKLISGDICAYINAGDFYSRHAFDIILDIFEKKNVKWLTGMTTIYNNKSQIVYSHLPYKYKRNLFQCGFYGRYFSHLQQESTFWVCDLNKYVDFKFLSKLKYAGDYYLWSVFSKYEELKIVEAYIGGFKKTKGQLSENIKEYRKEVDMFTRKQNIYDYLSLFDIFLWLLHPRVKKFFNKNGLYRYIHEIEEWK